MALYIPTIQSEYVTEGMLDQKSWAALVASGVIDQTTLNGLIKEGGDFVNIPSLNAPPDFARIDISSATPLSPTAAASTDDKGVICRDASVVSYLNHDVIRTGEAAMDQKLSRMYGNKLAKRAVQQLMRVAAGALHSVDTPTANCHIHSPYSATAPAGLTAADIRTAKYLMGDEADELNTLVIHSAVFNDLLRDLQENYKVDTVSGSVITNGRLNQYFGIGTIIVCDLVPVLNFTGSSALTQKYHSFLFGSGALLWGNQADPLVERDSNILIPSTTNYIKVSMNYCPHLRRVAWSSAASNPTDNDLLSLAHAGAGDHWNEAYVDHREVKATMIVSNGDIY